MEPGGARVGFDPAPRRLGGFGEMSGRTKRPAQALPRLDMEGLELGRRLKRRNCRGHLASGRQNPTAPEVGGRKPGFVAESRCEPLERFPEPSALGQHQGPVHHRLGVGRAQLDGLLVVGESFVQLAAVEQ